MTQGPPAKEETTLVIAGTYLLHEKVGAGSMSTVHKGVNLATGVPVAVKIMKKNLLKDADMVTRFNREIQTCTSLNHKNIVKVYDGGMLSTGEPFLVMELLRGTCIHDLLKSQKVLPLDRTLSIMSQAADALGFAHVRGYIHRDIKPQNIMIVNASGKKDFVKVLDFGVAKISSTLNYEDRFSTQPGQVLGTPQYMSPEQIRGDHLDSRSDVYALGCVLYYCLAGVPPINGDNAIAVMKAHLAEHPPHLNSVSPVKYPEELNDVVQKALNKLPVDRYTTMNGFAAELRSQMKHCQSPTLVSNIMSMLKAKR